MTETKKTIKHEQMTLTASDGYKLAATYYHAVSPMIGRLVVGGATGAGWNGWMPRVESLKVSLMWNIIYPVLTRWKGYAPFSLLGMGEDLPLGVYEQWRRWCKFPHYFFDDPEMSHVKGHYAEVKTPIVSAVALDDYWATPKSRDAFLKGYKNAPVTRLDIDPKSFQGGIGHMGYFRKTAEPLWKEVLGWFNQFVTHN